MTTRTKRAPQWLVSCALALVVSGAGAAQQATIMLCPAMVANAEVVTEESGAQVHVALTEAGEAGVAKASIGLIGQSVALTDSLGRFLPGPRPVLRSGLGKRFRITGLSAEEAAHLHHYLTGDACQFTAHLPAK